MKIVTNNKPRGIVSFFELKNKHQKEMLDKFGEQAKEFQFFTYKNSVYCLSDCYSFYRTKHFGKQWNAAYPATCLSTVLLRYTNCDSAVIVGIAYS